MTTRNSGDWQLPVKADPRDISSRVTTALLDRPEVTRMERLRLLGALDYLDDCDFHSRLQHSIGVAILAETLGQALELSKRQFDTFSAAALLHDSGHAPLSHTLHEFLSETWSFSHHTLSSDLVLGRIVFPGVDLPLNGFLEKHGIDPADVASIIQGEGPLGHLLSAPMNIDTLDAVHRIALSRNRLKTRGAFDLLALLEPKAKLTKQIESFWQLKSEVYTEIIYSDRALVFERIVVLAAIRPVLELGRRVLLMDEKSFVELIELSSVMDRFNDTWDKMGVTSDMEQSADVRQNVRRFLMSKRGKSPQLRVKPTDRVIKVNRKVFAEVAGLSSD